MTINERIETQGNSEEPAINCALFPKNFNAVDHMDTMESTIRYLKQTTNVSEETGLYYILDTIEESMRHAKFFLSEKDTLIHEQRDLIDIQKRKIAESKGNADLAGILIEKGLELKKQA